MAQTSSVSTVRAADICTRRCDQTKGYVGSWKRIEKQNKLGRSDRKVMSCLFSQGNQPSSYRKRDEEGTISRQWTMLCLTSYSPDRTSISCKTLSILILYHVTVKPSFSPIITKILRVLIQNPSKQ